MSTGHRISKAHLEVSNNLRITTVALPSSPHSSYCPTISHWWVFKDDSMCTACIQAKHKQKIIKVKIKRTTKPCELLHSNMWGPFSTPTSAGHCYYILFIDDYTCYTILSVLLDEQFKACTSAYHTDIRGKEKDLRYILAQLPSYTNHHTSKHIHYHTPLRNTHHRTYKYTHSPPHAQRAHPLPNLHTYNLLSIQSRYDLT